MAEKIYLSAEGRKALEERLKELNQTVLPDAVEKLKTAREFGDLSENAEYVTAKDTLARLTAEKEEIEAKLKFAVEYVAGRTNEVVSLGSTVKIYNETKGEEKTYIIVGTAEADIFAGKISNESAIGAALLGKRKGDVCTYTAPNNKVFTVKIIDILA